MKTVWKLFILVIAVATMFSPAAGNLCARELDTLNTHRIPVRSLSEETHAYQAGEHLKFTIHYVWGILNSDVGAATVDLDTLVVDGRKAFHCSVYGKTIRWYDKFFPVREDFQSWFTVDSLVPLRFTRDTQEGKYFAKNTYDYRWDSEPPYVDADVFTTSSGQRRVSLALDSCTFDLPALFYFARNMDFDSVTPGERYPMTFVIDDDIYNVYFILHGRETRKIKGIGNVRTIKFSAKLIAGNVFTGDEDLTIWVSDDDNRVPLLFEAPILVGTVSGRLSEYSGLKYPFEALTKRRK